MKVRELIEALSAFDPEFEVLMPKDSCDVEPVGLAVLDWAAPVKGKLHLAYPDEPGQPVVRIVGPQGLTDDYFRNSSPDED